MRDRAGHVKQSSFYSFTIKLLARDGCKKRMYGKPVNHVSFSQLSSRTKNVEYLCFS